MTIEREYEGYDLLNGFESLSATLEGETLKIRKQ